MELNFSKKQIIEAVNNAKEGIKKYQEIMNLYQDKDVSKDKGFQKQFNHFYKMRQRSQEYYEEFYNYLEKNKNNKVEFEDALNYFYKKFNRLEASFSSKLIATIDPNYAIWDKYVLQNLNLEIPGYNSENRKEKIIKTYNEIRKKVDEIIKSEEGKESLKIFDEFVPNNKITKTKKIDFILWQLNR